MAEDTKEGAPAISAAEEARKRTLSAVGAKLGTGPKMSPAEMVAQARQIAATQRQASAPPPPVKPGDNAQPALEPEPEAPMPITAPEVDAKVSADVAAIERQRRPVGFLERNDGSVVAVLDAPVAPTGEALTVGPGYAAAPAGEVRAFTDAVVGGALAGVAVLGHSAPRMPTIARAEAGEGPAKVKHTDLATAIIDWLIAEAPNFHVAEATLRVVGSRFAGDWSRALAKRKAAARGAE